MRIDSIRLTDCDAFSDDFAEISPDGKSPRSFIRIEKGNGTTEISNSEIGYLGFNGSKSSGLSFTHIQGAKWQITEYMICGMGFILLPQEI
jgi:hypothetical protein